MQNGVYTIQDQSRCFILICFQLVCPSIILWLPNNISCRPIFLKLEELLYILSKMHYMYYSHNHQCFVVECLLSLYTSFVLMLLIHHYASVQSLNSSTYTSDKLIFLLMLWSIVLCSFYPRPVLAFGYCRWLRLSVCVCGKHLLVRAITCHGFKLESPNLDHKSKTPWLRSLLFWGVIDLELQGQI